MLPTLWARNTWSAGATSEGSWVKPRLALGERTARSRPATPRSAPTGWLWRCVPRERRPRVLFTENETNTRRHYGVEPASPYVKDAFHEYVVHGNRDAVNPSAIGTKAAPHYVVDVSGPRRDRAQAAPRRKPSGDVADAAALGGRLRCRASPERIREADRVLRRRDAARRTADERRVMRQAYAGLLWSKQFYHYVVKDWLDGDPGQPPPPPERLRGRNADWRHLYNRDVISMPDAVGVPLVRRVGPRVPHDPVRADRPAVRQGAARAAAARVVHASERTDPRLRIRLLRRQPAGARLGRVARVQDDRRARDCAIASSSRGSSRS